MIVGSALAAPGFSLLALSDRPILYFAAWIILGTAGSATLTTAAYVMLNEIAGRQARNAIAALMLATGLSSSLFWPATAFLSATLGWRETCFVYAAAMIVVCLPLYVFGLPRRAVARQIAGSPADPADGPAPIPRKGTFYLIVSAITLNAFVTFGFSAVLVELLKAEGLPPSEAVAFASVLGVIGVSARGIDFIGGGRWDAITTGIFAAAALPVAMLLLILGHGAHWSIVAFIVIYGLGAGALAVVRATMPLVFYDKEAYAKAASHIALPLNLISALSPPVLISLLTNFGSNVLLGLVILCPCAALLILLQLRSRRPPIEAVAAA